MQPNTEQKNAASPSVDVEDVARFTALASKWWQPDGDFAALHKLNPVRIAYIRDAVCARNGRESDDLRPLEGLTVLDIGCGGGLLSEPLARLGAAVTGIDAGAAGIRAAQYHAREVDLEIDYRHTTAEELAAGGATFDVVLAMEVLEHVADLDEFVAAAAALTAPGGLFFGATLNRTPKAFAMAIVGAEYLLRWVPRGTHDWRKFVRPSELGQRLRRGGLKLDDVSGVGFDPSNGDWRIVSDTAVNYMVRALKA